MDDDIQQSETITETVLHVSITSEAPYATNVISSALAELANTLDFTGMYAGNIRVTTPSGDVVQEWTFGADWNESENG